MKGSVRVTMRFAGLGLTVGLFLAGAVGTGCNATRRDWETCYQNPCAPGYGCTLDHRCVPGVDGGAWDASQPDVPQGQRMDSPVAPAPLDGSPVDEVDALVVDEIAMFDAGDTGAQGVFDPARALSMSQGSVDASRPGLLHDDPNLVDAELARVRRVGCGEHSAGSHDLDPIGTGPNLQTSGFANLFDAVADARRQIAGVGLKDDARRRPSVAVAAGLGEWRTADLSSRPRERTRRECPFDAGRRVPRVANRGDARLQELAASFEGPHNKIGGGPLNLIRYRFQAKAQVDVTVDDAGENRQASGVDPVGVTRRRDRGRGTRCCDSAALVGGEYAVEDRIRRTAVEQPRSEEYSRTDGREH